MTKVSHLISPGTRLRFKGGKTNTQSYKSARRESAPKLSGQSHKVGTMIKFGKKK